LFLDHLPGDRSTQSAKHSTDGAAAFVVAHTGACYAANDCTSSYAGALAIALNGDFSDALDHAHSNHLFHLGLARAIHASRIGLGGATREEK
jgi:hypothetical protein